MTQAALYSVPMETEETTDELEGVTVWAPTYNVRGAKRCQVTIHWVDEEGKAVGTRRIGRHFQRYNFSAAQTESIRRAYREYRAKKETTP